MPRPNVLVIAVDGLRASALGAYGNASYPTPTFNRFASQSVLCDSYFADSTELSLLYRGLWQANSALRTHAIGKSDWSLPEVLSGEGYATRLIADCREIVEFPAVQQFSEAVLMDESTTIEATEIEQTITARVLSEVLEYAASHEGVTERPWFLWTHLSGTYGSWDAPHELAMTLIEEGDEAPEPSVAPPDRKVDRSAQADEIYSESCRYAAQVMALDSLLAPLCDLLDGGALGDCVCILMGIRGFPLGEHGQLGGVDGRLYSEQLHVPLLVRMPDGRNALSRVPSLVYPPDLPTAILRMLDMDAAAGDGKDCLRAMDQSNTSFRTYLLASRTNRTLSIRTPSWYLRMDDQNEGEEGELFVKPDDRWEMNDVASLCSEMAAELKEFAIAERTRIEAGAALDTAPLPVHLVESMH